MKAVLVMYHRGTKREFPLSRAATQIGRKPEAMLRIPTADVSRLHCEVRLDGSKIVVKDLGSANGTYVNGKRVAEQKLDAGDKLTVGPVTFVVQIDGKPNEITPEMATAPKMGGSAKSRGGSAAGAVVGGEDELFELGEADFDLDDPITALEKLEDEDDMP